MHGSPVWLQGLPRLDPAAAERPYPASRAPTASSLPAASALASAPFLSTGTKSKHTIKFLALAGALETLLVTHGPLKVDPGAWKDALTIHQSDPKWEARKVAKYDRDDKAAKMVNLAPSMPS